MDKRHFYNSQFQFEGSMDDDGNLYDERHARIGQVRDGTIYDNTNIRRGYIGDDGQVQDLNHIPIGKEYSSFFNGWSGHRDGYVRNDVLGTEHGNDYGIFSLVKDRDHFGSGMDDGSDDYCDDGGMDDDSDDDGWDDFDSRPRRPSYRRGRESHDIDDEDVVGCCKGCGCIVAILFVLYLIVVVFGS